MDLSRSAVAVSIALTLLERFYFDKNRDTWSLSTRLQLCERAAARVVVSCSRVAATPSVVVAATHFTPELVIFIAL